MMGVLACALPVAFILSMFSLTYNLDYIANIVNSFPKGVAELALRSKWVGGVQYVGFDTGAFVVGTEDYFIFHLDDKYGSDSYELTFKFYEHELYKGTPSLPTGVYLTFETDIVPLIGFKKTLNFFVKENSSVDQ